MLDPILILDINDLKRIEKLKKYALNNPIYSCLPGQVDPRNPTVEKYRENHLLHIGIGFEVDYSIEIHPDRKKYHHLSMLHESKCDLHTNVINDILYLFDIDRNDMDILDIEFYEKNYIFHIIKKIAG